MVLREATIGGVVYLDWNTVEMAKPEAERVTFQYGPLTNREKINLLHSSSGLGLMYPNGADVCLAAIDAKGLKIKNLSGAKGEVLDTVQKLLEYNDAGNETAYMVELVGVVIWRRQSGEEVGLKN